MKKTKWSYDSVKREADRHFSRSGFARYSRKAYEAAWRNGWLDLVCAHMTVSEKFSYKKWNMDDATSEAKKYRSRSEFKRLNSGAYSFLLNCGGLDAACSHMVSRTWSIDSAVHASTKYTTTNDFISGDSGAHSFLSKKKLLRKHCQHLFITHKWTNEEVIEEARKYYTRSEFFSGNHAAYKAAIRLGIKDVVCKHMDDGDYGFNPKIPAVLYFIRIDLSSGASVFKAGITNRDPKDRIRGIGMPVGAKATVLKELRFPVGASARIAESALFARFGRYMNGKARILRNGNKELLPEDALPILGLCPSVS